MSHRPQFATAVTLRSANVHEVALIPSRVNIINTWIKRINQFLLHQISDGNKKCKQTLKDPSVFLVHLLHVGGAGFLAPGTPRYEPWTIKSRADLGESPHFFLNFQNVFETVTLLYFASRIRPQCCILHVLKSEVFIRGEGEGG